MGLSKMQKKMNMGAAGEFLYLSAAALYVAKAFSDTTLFFIPWPQNYDGIVRVLLCASLFLRACAAQKQACCKNRAMWMFCILTVLLFKLSWLSTGYSFLLDTAFLIMGAVGIFYRKILKLCFRVGLFVFITAMLGSFTGCIADLVYSSSRPRHSFGIVYPTDFAAHVTFLVLVGWTLYGGYSILPSVCALGLAAFIFNYTEAKCSTLVLLLFTGAVCFHACASKLSRSYKKMYIATKFIDSVLPYIMPLCALAMIILTIFYHPDNKVISGLNNILNYRLSLGKSAMDTYGIKPFGTAFEQIGFGGGTAWSWTYTYNFVDSSYVMILVRYGAALLLALCAQYITLVKRALRGGHRRLALAAALIAVHSAIEHHLPEAAYNLFLLLPFADFSSQDQEYTEHKLSINGKTALLCIILLAICIVGILTFPITIGYIKTIVDLLCLNANENHIYFILMAAILIAAINAFLVSMLKSIGISGRTLHDVRKGTALKGIAIGRCILPLILLCAILAGEQVIRRNRHAYQPLLEQERPMIEALLATPEVRRLYIDHIPELYRREYHGISNMVLTAEGLARQKDIVLITEDLKELQILMDADYHYGELSPQHAVYTNSAAAKQVLEDSGIAMTDYYGRKRQVDLLELAALNGLEITENNTLLLNSPQQSISHGMGVTIYKGILRIEYTLRLKNSPLDEDIAATVKVTSDWGIRNWGQGEVKLSDFDMDGQGTYCLDVKLPFDCPNVEFHLYVREGVELEVQEITYGKVE